MNDPDGFPSDFPPVWWIGLDSGSGPIGPNGPWAGGGNGVFGSGWDYLHGAAGGGWAAPLPIVTRATALITGPLTSAPFRQVELGSGRAMVRGRWITDPMLLRPDARIQPNGAPAAPAVAEEMQPAGVVAWPAVLRLARSIFWTEWVRSAIWFGKGVFLCQRYTQPSDFDDQGRRISRPSGVPVPGTMKLLHPLAVDTVRGEDGLVWAIWPGSGEEVAADRDGWIDLGGAEYQLVVLRNPHSPVDDDGRSSGVFDLNPAAFQLERQLETYASGTFRSGIPAGYLKVHQNGLTQEAANELKANWLRNHGGDRRSIAVLNAVTEFVPLNLSPVDAALAQVKRLAIADVAFAFGLDPITLGAGLQNSGTYTNIRDAWENHRDFGLSLWIGAVQDTLTALTPGTQGVLVDVEQFGNPTLKEQYEAAKIAVEAGLITPDEWRADRGLPPLWETEDQAQGQQPAAAVGLLPTGRAALRLMPAMVEARSETDGQKKPSVDGEEAERVAELGVRDAAAAEVPDRHVAAGAERAGSGGAVAHRRVVSDGGEGGTGEVGGQDPQRGADLRAHVGAGEVAGGAAAEGGESEEA